MTNDRTNATVTGFGAHLKATREGMRLSEKDVAARLHLNTNIIVIIENEQFENGPPMIFMRGYMRSYAKLLNLPEKDVNAALAKFDNTQPSLSPFPSRHAVSGNASQRYMPWATLLIILILLALVAMWWNTRVNTSPTIIAPAPESTPVVTAPTPTETAVQPNPVAPAVGPTVPANVSPAAAPVTPAPTVVEPQAEANPTPKVVGANKKGTDLAHLPMELPEPGLETGGDSYPTSQSIDEGEY